MEKYPDFIKEGGSYDIPRDQYEKLVDILDKYQNSPSQLAKRDYTTAKKIDDFLKKKELMVKMAFSKRAAMSVAVESQHG